jgi:hypothetical protein
VRATTVLDESCVMHMVQSYDNDEMWSPPINATERTQSVWVPSITASHAYPRSALSTRTVLFARRRGNQPVVHIDRQNGSVCPLSRESCSREPALHTAAALSCDAVASRPPHTLKARTH